MNVRNNYAINFTVARNDTMLTYENNSEKLSCCFWPSKNWILSIVSN